MRLAAPRPRVWLLRSAPTTLALLASLVPATRPLSAQGVTIGFKGGLNIADVSSSEFEFGRGGTRTAFLGGAFAAIAGTGSFIVQPEALYARRGFTALVPGGTATAAIDYVEVPVLFKIRLVDQNRRVRPSAFAGSFIAFEASCGLSGALESLGGDSDCDGLLARRGKLDAGVILGAGTDIGLRDRWFLTFDARLNVGVLNLNWVEEDDRLTSRIWSFTAGAGVLLDP